MKQSGEVCLANLAHASAWRTGPEVWDEFVDRHPELGYKPGRWTFHNFLRFYRQGLLDADAIRLAKGRHWIAHVERFAPAAFDLATATRGRVAAAGWAESGGSPSGREG